VSVLFIGKRFYTNRDALCEKYGRIYQLPWHWSRAGVSTRLWLVDYHERETVRQRDETLEILSTPVRNLAVFRHWAAQAFTENRPSMVVASGDCYIGLMAYRIAQRFGAHFVFDVYDKYDEFGGYRRLPGFDPFRYLLRQAYVRLYASRALMLQFPTEVERSILVPNGVDMHRFAPSDLRESRRTLGLPEGKLLVGYFGGMEPDRGVADLIEAIQQLRADGMDVELLLGGRQVAGLDVYQPGVRYLGNVAYDRMPITLASCDLLAVPYRRSAFMDAGASNKIAEAIACRRPLVATRTPNLVINFPAQAEFLGALLATPGDPTDLARVISAQSVQRVLVDMPIGMDWEHIAMHVAEELSLLGRRTLSRGDAAV
jgi:glycosyltransferase involved in cell wall biosynthesis